MRLPALVVLIAALAVLAGCSSTTAATPPSVSTPLAIGGEGWAFTTKEGSGRLSLKSARWVPDTGGTFPSPAENGAYLVMDVSVDVTDGKYRFIEYEWMARDASGKSWPCLRSHWFEPGFPSSPVQAGQSAGGTVACDMPRGDVTVVVGDTLSWAVPA